MLEKVVKAAVRKRLKELGAYQFWVVPMGLGETTVDVIGCLNGMFFGIECKRPGAVPTLRQKFVMELIRKAGGITEVVDNVEQARTLFGNHIKSN